MIPQMNVLHTSVNMFGSQPGQDPINHHAMPDKPYNNAMWHFQNRTTMPKVAYFLIVNYRFNRMVL